jgi:hypothetical protein
MRFRVIGIAALVGLTAAAAVTYARWRTAGREEMQSATERVAAAAARSDCDPLAADPLFKNRSGTVDFLLRHGPALAGGYQVTVCRNGADGCLLMPNFVTHLGQIKTASGTLYLGFRYDRASGLLEFVTASFSTWAPS